MWNNPTNDCELKKAIERAKIEYLTSKQHVFDTINDNCYSLMFNQGFFAGIKTAIELLN